MCCCMSIRIIPEIHIKIIAPFDSLKKGHDSDY